jgi:hypothetical protein
VLPGVGNAAAARPAGEVDVRLDPAGNAPCGRNTEE